MAIPPLLCYYGRNKPMGLEWNCSMMGYHCDLEMQRHDLYAILEKNTVLFEVIQGAQALGLEHYYIGAGCICQPVWNFQNQLDLMHGISDVDVVYFDEDLTEEKENRVVRQVEKTFSHLPVKLDVKNQARVHLWYEGHYGYALRPYRSVEDAINTWPTTATAVGVKIVGDQFVVYAPFGLNDLFGQIVRANKTQITRETYRKKCEKWRKKWSTLQIIEW